MQLAAIALVWGTIRLRPVLAASLESLESGWAGAPVTPGMEAALVLEDQAALDLRLAQAEARRSVEMMH